MHERAFLPTRAPFAAVGSLPNLPLPPSPPPLPPLTPPQKRSRRLPGCPSRFPAARPPPMPPNRSEPGAALARSGFSPAGSLNMAYYEVDLNSTDA